MDAEFLSVMVAFTSRLLPPNEECRGDEARVVEMQGNLGRQAVEIGFLRRRSRYLDEQNLQALTARAAVYPYLE